MASVRSRLARAAALHRHAVATTAAAERALAGHAPHQQHDAEQRELAERMRALAAELAPGWLGLPLASAAASHPLGAHDTSQFVRVGAAQPLDDTVFPLLVPLLKSGHLTIDADARDPRVAGALRAVLLRLLAATPAGRLLVRAVDAADAGALFASFAPLAEAGLMPTPATDRAGLQAVLSEAEQWVRVSAIEHRPRLKDRLFLVVIGTLPELTDGTDLARIYGVAQAGPATGLHLIVAGWPPPPLTAETTQARLPFATQIAVRNPYAVVAGPPDSAFGQDTPVLNAPVFLDDDPPAELIERVCRELAGQAAIASQLHLADVLPPPDEPLWTADAAGELATVVGLAGDSPIALRFNDLTPHWLVGGRSGAGRTAFLFDVLFGLSTLYGPDQLHLYYLDFSPGADLSDLVPTGDDPAWLPHLVAAGIEPDREYALAVLRHLVDELTRRENAQGDGAATKVPRLLCVVDEFPTLVTAEPDALPLIDALTRRGRAFGVHLVLASRGVRGVEGLHAQRESPLAQFLVRVALPGGDHVLAQANEAASGLPLGAAVVNTAGGLGGPRGATRGHEKTIRFPDPHGHLADVKRRLWAERPPGSAAPSVFVGHGTQHLADDPTYGALRAGGPPRVLLGRHVDLALSTVVVPFDATAGRHLAILGPSEVGADLLDAAVRGLAAQHDPGTVRFLLAPLAPGTQRATGEAEAALGEAGHRTVLVASAALPDALAECAEAGLPTYLCVFGADALHRPADALRTALREGPRHGHHVLAWWRGLGRFTDDVGPNPADVAALVFLNTPGSDASHLIGRPVHWQPRPNRALLYDRRTDRADVFVPFLRTRRRP